MNKLRDNRPLFSESHPQRYPWWKRFYYRFFKRRRISKKCLEPLKRKSIDDLTPEQRREWIRQGARQFVKDYGQAINDLAKK